MGHLSCYHLKQLRDWMEIKEIKVMALDWVVGIWKPLFLSI